mgnify:FL=1
MKKLVIIGNGFDIAHNLKTSYWDFREFLKKEREQFLYAFERMYNIFPPDFSDPRMGADAEERWNKKIKSILWEEFETEIGKPNIAEMLDASESILEQMDLDGGNIGIEDTMDEYWRLEYGFVQKFQLYVKEWIEKISTNHVKPIKDGIIDDEESFYMSFNYTDTLENVYHIENVLHIHGGVDRVSWVEPIMGHCNTKDIEYYKNKAIEADECFDEGSASINHAVVNYLKSIYKNTDKIIEANIPFFDKLKDVEEVTVIGWSAGQADIPYLKKIFESIMENTVWHVYWYDNKAKTSLIAAFDEVGIPNKNRNFRKSSEYWD